MGFPLVCRLGSCISLWKFHNEGLNLQRSPTLLRRDVGFKFLKHEFYPQSKTVLCKCEPADFDERKSPGEVWE